MPPKKITAQREAHLFIYDEMGKPTAVFIRQSVGFVPYSIGTMDEDSIASLFGSTMIPS